MEGTGAHQIPAFTGARTWGQILTALYFLFLNMLNISNVTLSIVS